MCVCVCVCVFINLKLNLICTMGCDIDTPPSSLMDSIVNPKVKATKGGVRARSLAHNTLGVEQVLELWDETRKNEKKSITHTDLHKLNNKLVSAWLMHFWC